MAENKNVLLSVKDLHVKFRVRGRELTAIRGISLDILENESIAIVGESGSGKSVFTKTFAGMLDSNGYISNGSIVFHDKALTDTHAKLTPAAQQMLSNAEAKLNDAARLEYGAATYQKLQALESEKRVRSTLSDEERAAFARERKELQDKHNNLFNAKQAYDPSKEKDKIREAGRRLKEMEKEMKALAAKEEQAAKDRKAAAEKDAAFNKKYAEQKAVLDAQYEKIGRAHV